MEIRLQTLLERSAEAWGTTLQQATELLALRHQKTLRINTLKAKKSTLKAIKSLGVELQQLPWCDNAYSVIKGYDKLSRSDMFNNGEFILQDAASFVPALALAPKPGELVLDICAAPGGKTTHVAALSKNKALITANDTSRARFFKMRDMFDRYGVNASTTLYDGRLLHKHLDNQLFDKILLDAPCSGEAAMDPNDSNSYEQWSTAKIKRLSRLQEQLIITAYDMLKPGGMLVYSTCTIAPEENELVVNYLLKRRNARIEQIDIPIDNVRPGLVTWHGKQLHADLAKTYRLLPSATHEAFYTAKITRPISAVEEEYTYNL